MPIIDKESFLTDNCGLVRKFAYKYHFNTPKFSIEDLVQVGNQAAIRALDSFDDSRGVKPQTYVGRAIDRDIREFVRANKHDVYVSNHTQRKSHREEDGRDFRELVAVRLDWGWENAHGEAKSFSEVLPSGMPPPEQKMMVEEQKNILLEEINKLPETQQRVIKGKYFENINFVELGAELGVSKQRAKQIEQSAFATLKTRLGPRLDGFITRADGLARRGK